MEKKCPACGSRISYKSTIDSNGFKDGWMCLNKSCRAVGILLERYLLRLEKEKNDKNN